MEEGYGVQGSPCEYAVAIIGDMLSKDDTLPDRTKLSVAQVVDLLNLCLTTTYFVYAGCFYAQREGAAMGSPVSPVVANLFMEHFEQKALATFLHPIKFWGRYVDDVLSILKTAQEDGLFTHLNNVDKRIQWTKEQSVNRSIAMLDERITAKEDGHLNFSVYRKSTHTDQYLQYDSHQPLTPPEQAGSRAHPLSQSPVHLLHS